MYQHYSIQLFLVVLLALATGTAYADTRQEGTTQQAAKPSAVLDLATARATALENNPGLAAAQARAQAAAQRPHQAGALPDPRLSLNAMNLPTDTYDLDQEAMTQLQVGISQTFPFPGKRGLRQQAAQYQAQAAQAQVDTQRQVLLRDVTQGWWKLAYFDRALEIVERNQVLLRQFIDVARTKYKVGTGLQQDILLAQVELSKLLNSALQLKAMRRASEARLNALLNRDANSAILLPQALDQELPELLQESEYLTKALLQRPVLTAAQQQRQAAHSRLDLARKERLPDFTLGASYGKRDGNNPDGSERTDFASLMLSMNVPLYATRKQNKAVAQSHAALRAQDRTVEQTRSQISAEVAGVYAEYQQAREQVQLFKQGIIPQARLSVASMLSGYQVNKVDFLNLVRAQITLFNFETQYWKAVSEANQALAHLAAAIGQESVYE